MEKAKILSELKKWIKECCLHGFPRSEEDLIKESDRLCCKYHTGSKKLYTKSYLHKYFRQNDISFIKLAVNNDGVKVKLNLLLRHHEYTRNLLEKQNLLEVRRQSNRVFYATLNCYRNTFKESDTFVLHTFSATGTMLDEFIICHQRSFQVESKTKDFYFKLSPNGMFTGECLIAYFKQCFVPFLKNSNIKCPVIIFIDNLEEFITAEVLNVCRYYKIVLLAGLPNAFFRNGLPAKELINYFNDAFQTACGKYTAKEDLWEFPHLYDLVYKQAQARIHVKSRIIQMFEEYGWFSPHMNDPDYPLEDKLMSLAKKLIIRSNFQVIALDKKPIHENFMYHSIMTRTNKRKLTEPKDDGEEIASSTSHIVVISEYEWNSKNRLQTQRKASTPAKNDYSDKQLYLDIEDSTLAGLFLNVHVPVDFIASHPDVTQKFLPFIWTTQKLPSTIEHQTLVEWHRNCTNYLESKNLLPLMDLSSKVLVLDVNVYQVQEISPNGTKEAVQMITVAHIINGFGMRFRPIVGCNGNPNWKSDRMKNYAETVDFINYDENTENFLEICLQKIKRNILNVKGIIFINPYKFKIEASTKNLSQSLGFHLIGLYPNPHRNFNPIEVLLNIDQLESKKVCKDKTNQSKSAKTISTNFDILDTLREFNQRNAKPTIREVLQDFGLVPWTEKYIKVSTFDKCKYFPISPVYVVYKNHPTSTIPRNLDINSQFFLEDTGQNEEDSELFEIIAYGTEAQDKVSSNLVIKSVHAGVSEVDIHSEQENNEESHFQQSNATETFPPIKQEPLESSIEIQNEVKYESEDINSTTNVVVFSNGCIKTEVKQEIDLHNEMDSSEISQIVIKGEDAKVQYIIQDLGTLT